MMHHILLVDDEPNVLQGLHRSLRGRYQLHLASSGAEALAHMQTAVDFAVVVSDMRMPVMDGITLLRQARQVRPLTVRAMLTGNADLHTAIQAVNEGNVFRFATKPCEKEHLTKLIDACVEQHLLLTAERELLEKTLAGSVQALTEILSLLDPRLFGKCTTLRDWVRKCESLIPKEERWEIETAAMLAPIGTVAIPPVVVMRSRQGASLTKAELAMLERIPEVGFQLLNHIPRLERVANIVRHQGHSADSVVPLGSRLLRILRDALDRSQESGSVGKALKELRGRSDGYDPNLLGEVCRLLADLDGDTLDSGGDPTEPLPLKSLQLGHVTAKSILTNEGTVLVGAGQAITPTILERLHNFAATMGVQEPVVVYRASRPVHSET